ncbi:MAG: PD-(D/E)XK nuclease family protein [Anaerolineae bacterium]|nr:PD-(D/E)XK nuclease family protein [Anaerolineae bacterium]
MMLPDDFVFSQSSLQDYADCPRRFELRYGLRLRWPAVEADPVLEHERHLLQGAAFHHAVHQHGLGVPAEDVTRLMDDAVIEGWWRQYLQSEWATAAGRRHPEITLSMPLGEHRLMAKFDLLLVTDGGEVQIIDWKTSAQAARTDWLLKRLQTRVYRLVLARAGEELTGYRPLKPDQLEMIYWYVNGQAVRLAYDTAELERDEAELLRLMDEISTREVFPLTEDVRRCAFCTYRSLCNRGEAAGVSAEWDDEAIETTADEVVIDLDQIAEIEF